MLSFPICNPIVIDYIGIALESYYFCIIVVVVIFIIVFVAVGFIAAGSSVPSPIPNIGAVGVNVAAEFGARGGEKAVAVAVDGEDLVVDEPAAEFAGFRSRVALWVEVVLEDEG